MIEETVIQTLFIWHIVTLFALLVAGYNKHKNNMRSIIQEKLDRLNEQYEDLGYDILEATCAQEAVEAMLVHYEREIDKYL